MVLRMKLGSAMRVLRLGAAKYREVDIAQVVAVRHRDAIVVAMNRGRGA